jgi:hypothetical protein
MQDNSIMISAQEISCETFDFCSYESDKAESNCLRTSRLIGEPLIRVVGDAMFSKHSQTSKTHQRASLSQRSQKKKAPPEGIAGRPSAYFALWEIDPGMADRLAAR